MRPGEVIKERRIRNGMTVKELATMSGMTRTNLGNIERGKQSISLRQAIRFSELLCFNLNEFTERPTREIITIDLLNDIENKIKILKGRLG